MAIRKILLVFATFCIFNSCIASDKRDGLIGENVAMFYPSNFDSMGNLPSFALTKEFPNVGKIPSGWKLTPVFYHKDGKAIATLPVNEGTSLYGTGEVTGPLLRNGKSICTWNSDNYMYGKFEGRQLYQSHPWVLGVNKDGSAFGVLADNTWLFLKRIQI